MPERRPYRWREERRGSDPVAEQARRDGEAEFLAPVNVGLAEHAEGLAAALERVALDEGVLACYLSDDEHAALIALLPAFERAAGECRALVESARSAAEELEERAKEGRHSSGRSLFESDREARLAHGRTREILAAVESALRGAADVEAVTLRLANHFDGLDADSWAEFAAGIAAALRGRRNGAGAARAIVAAWLQARVLPDSVAPLADAADLERQLAAISRGRCCDSCRTAKGR